MYAASHPKRPAATALSTCQPRQGVSRAQGVHLVRRRKDLEPRHEEQARGMSFELRDCNV